MDGAYAGCLHKRKPKASCIAENLHAADHRHMSDTLYREQVGRRLRAAIDALGITYTAAAGALEISTSKLGNWMRGEHYPDRYSVNQFCDRFGITAEWIYRGKVTGLPSDLANALWKAEQAPASEPPLAPQAPPKERRPPHPPRRGNVPNRGGKPPTRHNGAGRQAGD